MRNNQQKVRVKTARRRRVSSTRWLQRQLNDPYVKEAKEKGYRSRAAFKLLEIDEKFYFLEKGKKVVDLGAAPGGWSQLAVQKVGKDHVIAIDLLEMDPIPGVIFFQKDFTDTDAPELLKQELKGDADIVLSDMAANTVGHPQTDHLRIMALLEEAFLFAKDVLKEGGVFVAKIFQGGAEGEILTQIKQSFQTVKHVKPQSSRKDSVEMYLIALGFKGK